MGALLLLKVSLLLSVTLVAARLLGRAPAVTRHRLWSYAFAAVLALLPLAAAIPALYVPVPAAWAVAASVRPTSEAARGPAAARDQPAIVSTGHRRDANAPTIGERTPAPSDLLPPAEPDGPRSASLAAVGPSTSAFLLAAWLTGTTAAAALVLLSLLRVRRLVRTAEDVNDPAWQRAAATIGAQLGLRYQARLLFSSSVGTPMAGGLWRPAIFLPVSARAWSTEQRDVVLAHELTHLAGRDPLRHLVTRLALACYWFHPLAWIGARQSAVAREQACDEAVVALGTRPSAYARVLLDLAESLHPPARLLGALPMVHRSHLERRLMAILNVDVRPATRRLVFGPAIGVALFTLSVAAAQPFNQTQGRPFDQAQGRPFDQAQGRPEVSSSSPTIVPVVQPPAVAVVVAPYATTPVLTAQPVQSPPATTLTTGAQTAPGPGPACSTSDLGSGFSGSTNMSQTGGRTVIYEQVGWRGGDRVIQKTFGDLQLCMVAEDAGERTTEDRPSQWVGRARRVVLEARRGNVVQRLEVSRPATGGAHTSLQVGGVIRTFDAAAQGWRDRMLAVLDTTWELSRLRGEVSSLRGQISSIRGQRSSLQGEISSLRGEVSSMRGRASSIQGEQSSLRGRISSIQGHVSSLRGAISSERGAISSLNATRYGADTGERSRIAARITEHDAVIARVEREIGDYGADARIAAVEREIAALDASGKGAAIDAQVRAFDLDGKVAAVGRRIAALDVEGRIAAIEHQIQALDADRRGRQLEERRDAELTRLDAAIAAIR